MVFSAWRSWQGAIGQGAIVHINLELDAVGCYVYNLSHWAFMRFNVPTVGSSVGY